MMKSMIHYRFTNALVFYGVSFGSVDLGGNRYLNFFLISLMGVPANFAMMWAANRFVIEQLFSIAYNMMTIGLNDCLFMIDNRLKHRSRDPYFINNYAMYKIVFERFRPLPSKCICIIF
jgi:hypothetical protein